MKNLLRLTRSYLVPIAVAAFVLTGCCCIPRAGSTSKNCNCGSKGQQAATNKKATQPAKEQAVMVTSTDAAKIASNDLQLVSGIEPALIKKTTDRKAPAKKLPLGIKGIRSNIIAGPNMSFKSSEEDYGNTNHKHSPGAGVQLGANISYAFSEKFAVAPGLILKTNSSTETLSYTGEPGPGGPGPSTEIKSKYNYSYLSAPIHAEVKVSDQLTLVAGPEINLLLSANVKTTGYGGNDDKQDIKDHSVKVGAGVQAGVKYAIPNSPIGVQLIYDHRLSRLNEKNSEYYPGGGDIPAWRMKSIQFGLTFDICELLENWKKQ